MATRMDDYRVTPRALKVARLVDAGTPFLARPRHDREVALRMLAVALYNYHRAATSVTEVELKAANELTEEETAFFERYAVPAAMQAIWNGR